MTVTYGRQRHQARALRYIRHDSSRISVDSDRLAKRVGAVANNKLECALLFAYVCFTRATECLSTDDAGCQAAREDAQQTSQQATCK
jgi:hypothetical protein